MSTFKPDIENLPYNLPKTTSEQLTALTKKMRLPLGLMRGKGQKGVNILCGVIIYRHLNIHQKRDVMRMIHATNDPKIIGILTTKVTDIMVSSHWGLWSQSRAELEEGKKYYQFILNVGSLIGLTVSVNGLKGFLSELWKTGKVTPAGALLIVVWAGLYADQIILENINNELDSRKQFIKTKPY